MRNLCRSTDLAETWYRYEAIRKIIIELKAKNVRYRKKYLAESPKYLHDIRESEHDLKQMGVKLYTLLGDKVYVLDQQLAILYFKEDDSFRAIELYQGPVK